MWRVPQVISYCATSGAVEVRQMMSNSSERFTGGQKESSRTLAPSPLPDGEEIARRGEVGPRGSPLTHRIRVKTTVRDGEVGVKVSQLEGGRRHPPWGSGAFLTYHEWAQSGYTLESRMDRCDECGKICSLEHQNDGGCVFCNHPDLQD